MRSLLRTYIYCNNEASYQSPHTWYEANPPQILHSRAFPLPNLQHARTMSHHMTNVDEWWGDPIRIYQMLVMTSMNILTGTF